MLLSGPFFWAKGIDVCCPLSSFLFPLSYARFSLTLQAHYRREMAPLSDLFVVYTRGSDLPGNRFIKRLSKDEDRTMPDK